MTLDMTVQEIMDTYGVSNRQARRYKERGKIPVMRKPKNTAPPPVDIDKEAFLKEEPENSVSHDGTLFTVAPPPPDIFPEEKPLDKVFKALGLNAKKTEEKTSKVYDPKLNKAQQSIFDSFSPLAIALFMFCASWAWTKIDAELGPVLAPDKDIAAKIVQPLIRAYARHSKIAAALDPDAVDVTASMAALVGYVYTSFNMYQQLKAQRGLGYENTQQERNEQGNNSTGQYTSANGNNFPGPVQNGHDSTNHRRYAARTDSAEHGANNASVGYANNFDPRNLNETERYQYEKLSKLRKLDIDSRARRSGRG